MNIENKQILEQIGSILEGHMLIHKNLLVHKPFSLEDRQFIANNIPSHCFYNGIAYRIFFNVSDPIEGVENNCSWSNTIDGIKRFFNNSNTSCVESYIIKEANIYGIDVNSLVRFLSEQLPNFSVSSVVLSESEILCLEIYNWKNSDYVLEL